MMIWLAKTSAPTANKMFAREEEYSSTGAIVPKVKPAPRKVKKFVKDVKSVAFEKKVLCKSISKNKIANAMASPNRAPKGVSLPKNSPQNVRQMPVRRNAIALENAQTFSFSALSYVVKNSGTIENSRRMEYVSKASLKDMVAMVRAISCTRRRVLGRNLFFAIVTITEVAKHDNNMSANETIIITCIFLF